LLDERRARQAARNRGLNVVGLIGVLLEAKHKNLLPAIKPVLDDLASKAGFWISSELYKQTLRLAQELSSTR